MRGGEAMMEPHMPEATTLSACKTERGGGGRRVPGVSTPHCARRVNMDRTMVERNYLHRTKHRYHQNNGTHGRDENQTRRQPHSDTTVGRGHRRSTVLSPPAPTLDPPPSPHDSSLLQCQMSCKTVLSGLPLMTFLKY